ncbi:hypothetical protein RQP46_009091 [Phenoliferia psychrophenolica]
MSELTFPPISLLAFLPPVIIQCLLLHPVFPDAVSRPLRMVFAVPGVAYGLSAPLQHGFTPREACVGINFVLHVIGAYACWKAIEWGFVIDRTPYTWIGLESDQIVDKDGDGKNKVPLRKDRARLELVRRKTADTESTYEIVVSSLHLLLSMRGTGYAFGPSVHTLKKTAYRRTFLKAHLIELAWSHTAVVGSTIVLTLPQTTLHNYLAVIFPSLSPSAISTLFATLSTAALGLGAYAGLTIGYTTFALFVLLLSTLASFLPFSIFCLPPFPLKEYHRLFNEPWRFESAAVFWALGWHNLFARSFKTLGTDPTSFVVESLGGSQQLGKGAGIMVVFALSGWLHEQAIISSAYHMRTRDPPLPFIVQYGGTLYFLLQGVAILLEQTFTAATRRKVGGPLGSLWTFLPVVGGGYLVWKSWITLGLTSGMPDVTQWTWHRFVLPLAALLPPGIFTK